MAEILAKIGLTPLTVLIIIIAIYLLREVWIILKSTRLKVQQDIIAKMIDQIDRQIEEFYLPLSSRFRVSKYLYDISKQLIKDGKYDNGLLNIKSSNENALRDIFVRQIFIPLNNEIEEIMFKRSSLATLEDSTNYPKIITHFLLWRNLEAAIINGDIEKYSAVNFLQFPSKEIDNFLFITKSLISKRDKLREQFISFRPKVNNLNILSLRNK